MYCYEEEYDNDKKEEVAEAVLKLLFITINRFI